MVMINNITEVSLSLILSLCLCVCLFYICPHKAEIPHQGKAENASKLELLSTFSFRSDFVLTWFHISGFLRLNPVNAAPFV